MARNKVAAGDFPCRAEVKWCAADVKTLKPLWSLRKCDDWLRENERCIEDRLIAHGWDVVEELLGEA